MLAARFNPRVRRVALLGLAALAVVMVAAVLAVMFTEEQLLDPDEVFPPMVLVDPAKRPEFIFPESIRTFDLSLNCFVDRFARVCMEGKYADFRLMLSNRAGGPILARRFESMFNALKQVRILGLDRLPDLPGFEGPVYVLTARYELEDYALARGSQVEQRQLAVLKERGAWRIGPIPHEALARLEALRQATTQPASTPADPPTDVHPDPTSSAPPRATANRPARIGS